MKTAGLIFPHQLFAQNPVLKSLPDRIILIEDSLYFGDEQYPAKFHKQKLAYHRATMQSYAEALRSESLKVSYIQYQKEKRTLESHLEDLATEGIKKVIHCELIDHSLEKRLKQAVERLNIKQESLASPCFINVTKENQSWHSGKKKWAMSEFYRWQRLRLNILIEDDKPSGGQWSFDEENRKKLPKNNVPHLPVLSQPESSTISQAAMDSINTEFPDNPGTLKALHFPINHTEAVSWLEEFCNERLENFGIYEDAIVEDQNWLYHSALTPMLNIGLLTPNQVIAAVLQASKKHNIPINSTEGFVRQVIGWREFMRATYDDLGVTMRNRNHWQHHRKMPRSFYDGNTGILPVDNAIQRILDTGYCHHIERLMVLGGFMFLCEISPDEVYQWFMEMFVDSYDWVMVPNVYSMSQHADGGLITTKPYFSGSNYIIKMSHYKKGEWSEIWDALFWRWILKNKANLAGNYRWAMMCKNADRMPTEKRAHHIKIAELFLEKL